MKIEMTEELMALVKEFRDERGVALNSTASEDIKMAALGRLPELAIRLASRMADRLEAMMFSFPPTEPLPKSLYYIQDTRQVVGNCAMWWCPKGAGYTCNIAEAGRFTEAEIEGRRDTDVPWPCEEIDALAIKHVRVEALRAVKRSNDTSSGRDG